MKMSLADGSSSCSSSRTGENLGCERPTIKTFEDPVLLSSAWIADRPMPEVAPTKTAVSDFVEMAAFASRIAFMDTIEQA